MPSKFKLDETKLLVIVTFIALAVVIYNKSNSPRDMEAKKIKDMLLDDHKISLVSNGVIDSSKLRQLQSMHYSDLKSLLNAKNDFCVYIENDKGEIISQKARAG